jgi:hypothetical protein
MPTQSRTKTIAVIIHHPNFGEVFSEIQDLEKEGWKVAQILPVTYACGEGPVQDQTLIFRLEK